MRSPFHTLCAGAWLAAATFSLPAAGNPAPASYVDDQGVLRWTGTQAEVALFGVNYTAPFAHAFRAHQRLGIPINQAIDADVYHFARLGFDAYRIHIWDREISDAEGNLLLNEHVQAFDHLLAQLKRRGIKIVLTPLQFGNAGYPEPGVPLPGFSSRYGKKGSLEDRSSWPLQARYLTQLMEHVNPETGVAYKDDPDLVGVEICNEPGHFNYDLTVAYINTMVAAIRATGCAVPIFYNMSHGIPVHAAYLDANVQGGTFQWYPSNLVAGHEQRGNFLPYVDGYPIPFAGAARFQTKAKLVYEFDAADLGRAYIYPAIARTFRKARVQFATQFAYDPLHLAPVNSEYQTHYLNLAYTPQKALAMKIAAAAFRRIPLGHDYGAYPANTTFADVRVSYEEDLAELNTAREFFHSNSTATQPVDAAQLTEIAGCGSSPVIRYPGTGAYFLDQLAPGVWRLEVLPDAIRVRDPFEKPNPTKHVARIAWNRWPMDIRLPDLGSGFAARGINDGNTFTGGAAGTTLDIRPGVYLLTRQGVTTHLDRDSPWRNLVLKEFVAPASSMDKTYVVHEPLVEATAGRDLRLTATVAGPDTPHAVHLVVDLPKDPVEAAQRRRADPLAQPGGGNVPGTGPQSTGGVRTFAMQPVAGLRYAVTLPGAELFPGTLSYHIVVAGPRGSVTYPSEIAGQPADWSFHGQPWRGRLVPPGSPVLLFDAAKDVPAITADHRDVTYDLVPSDRPGTTAMAMIARELDEGEHDYSWRFFFRDKITGSTDRLAAARRLVVYGRSATDKPCKLQLSLVTRDGFAYGAIVDLSPTHGRYALPLAGLKPVRSPNIPHGYPVFIPFWSPPGQDTALDLQQVESILVSIGPGLAPDDYTKPHGVEIERLWLE